MSQSTPKTISRRSVLAGTAAVASATIAVPGLATASVFNGIGNAAASKNLCAAHHLELSQHLSRILNAEYVEDRMKNKALSTAHCPHCKVGIAPAMKSQAAFAALA